MSKYLAPSEDFSKGTAYMATFHSDHFGFKPKRVKQFTLSLRFSQGEDALTGALSAGARELASPLSKDSSEQTQQMISKIIGSVVGQAISGDEGAKIGANIAYLGEVYNRQLHQDEIALLKTKNALELKETLADISPNLSKENINYLYNQTQKAMVDKNGQQILNNIIEKAKAQGMENEVLTVINESKQQIIKDAVNNVYVDLQGKTPVLVPMMNPNNYDNPRYYPSSTAKQNINTFLSASLTTTGITPNPVVSGIAWGTDTIRNIYNESHDNTFDATKNTYLPAALGFPANKSYIQKAGAGLSYYNLVESINKYNNQRKILEWQKDNINNKSNKVLIKPDWLKDITND